MSNKSWKHRVKNKQKTQEMNLGYPSGTRFSINHEKLLSRLPNSYRWELIQNGTYDCNLSIIQSCLITFPDIKPRFLNDSIQITPESFSAKNHILFLPSELSERGIQAIGYSPNATDLISKYKIYTTRYIETEELYNSILHIREKISRELEGLIHYNNYTQANFDNLYLGAVFDAFYLRDRHVYRKHILAFYLDSASAMINSINQNTQFEQILVDENGIPIP